MRHTALVAVLLLALGGCSGDEADPASPPPTVPSASSTTPITVSTDAATPEGDPATEALRAFADWVGALHESDYQRAWNLMAPSSRASLGGFELFESWGSEMTEGWGSWAEASELTAAVEDDAAGRNLLVVSGTVTKEGMPESETTRVFFSVVDGRVVISPFEEFGNVAEGLRQPDATAPVPRGSGTARRIIYSNSDQRVWLVDDDESVVDTYLVSGREGVPDPGIYEVFSKSEIAYAGHDGITMRYMVRFTYAESGLAIGFHSIPNTASGEPLQSEEQLGEFHSAGCVRQSLGHAAALYDWANEGTIVHVLE